MRAGSPDRVDRRLAAILAADVAGYSRLMGADEEGTHERLKAHLVELVDPKIHEHRGRVVKNTGDGVLAEFASVVDAVRCAAEIQRAMADRDLDLAQERRLRFRIGVNLGDVIADGDDIYGDGVNIAARLEGLAAPGGICISGTVRDHIGDRLPYTFEDMGEQSVKNIARPVRVYALRPDGVAPLPASGLPTRPSRRAWAIIGTAAAAALIIACVVWWFWPATISPPGAGKSADQAPTSAAQIATAPAATAIAQPTVAPRLSIVVLPFANLSNDPNQQYFADGITEDLTTNLSRLPDMFVISRNSAFTYRNKLVDTKQIGRELGVRYVLEGSVQRSGNRVRVTSQLINAESDAHLWAERFDRDTNDLFALQDEITTRIAVALNLELIGAEAARPTEHPDALDYIFRGRAANAKPPTRESKAESIGFYERAAAADPGSIDAQSRLADGLAGRVLDGMSDSPAEDIKRAEALLAPALATSPRNPFLHYIKGQLLRAVAQGPFGLDAEARVVRFADAIPEYEIYLAANPNDVGVLAHLAWCKFMTGADEEAIPLMEKAIRLSPRDPRLYLFYTRLGTVHLFQGHVDEAILWLEKARRDNPPFPTPHWQLAAAYGLKGDTARAKAELAEARETLKRRNDDRFGTIALVRKNGDLNTPPLRDRFEEFFITGLRKAGMPE